MAVELTASSRDDASTLPALLDTIEVPIRRFTADGAYDHRSVYDQLSAAGTENVVIVIPPRRSAVSAGPTDGPWAQRDTALERIRQVGRREWQKESGYRQQARVENSFFRYKSVLGGGLKARHGKAQRSILCLTEQSNNHLMWVNYARNHTGFVLGFEGRWLTRWVVSGVEEATAMKWLLREWVRQTGGRDADCS